MTKVRLLLPALTALAVVFSASCASISVTNTWTKEGFSGPAFKKVLVVGTSKQEGVRRTFEDDFAQQLEACGLSAMESYSLIPDASKIDEPALKKAVADCGADCALVIRLVKVENKEEISPGAVEPMILPGFYGFDDWAWDGFYDPPIVYNYDVVTMETKLFETQGGDLVWDLSTESTLPADLPKSISKYSTFVVCRLAKDKMIECAPKKGCPMKCCGASKASCKKEGEAK